MFVAYLAAQAGLDLSGRARVAGEITAVEQQPGRRGELLFQLLDDPGPPGQAPCGVLFSPAGFDVADDVAGVEEEQVRRGTVSVRLLVPIK